MQKIRNWNIPVEATPQAVIGFRLLALIFILYLKIFLSIV